MGKGALAIMLTITSPSFKSGEKIPVKFTCDGSDVSPALSWTGAPKQTKAFALVMEDPDAPVGLWIHWVVYDLPASTTSLKEGAKDGTAGQSWGVHKFERAGYSGPCPPPGKPHRYFFRLYALSAPTGLKAKAAKAELLKAMEGKVLAEAELVGLYGR